MEKRAVEIKSLLKKNQEELDLLIHRINVAIEGHNDVRARIQRIEERKAVLDRANKETLVVSKIEALALEDQIEAAESMTALCLNAHRRSEAELLESLRVLNTQKQELEERMVLRRALLQIFES